MKRFGLLALALTATMPAHAQMTFTDRPSYCRAASEASTTTLVVRTQNLPRKQAEAMMEGMTDPQAIKMVKQVIDFAYSRPASTSVEDLRKELRDLCIDRKIF